MVDPSGTSSNTYDELNRLISYADANGFTVGYEYDSRGQISKITYPDGKTVSYQYDNLGQISQVAADWLSNTTASYQYDAARRLVGATQFNNVNLTYSYDNADRLTGISYQGSSPITDYQYTLDGNGNRTRAVINAEPVKPKKLINDSTTNLFNTARNRLESSNGLTLTYDNEGQLISKGSTAYAFDYAHRLVQVGTSTFVYDGVGNRISATRAGVTTKYIYDARGNLLAEANASNQIIRHYIYGRGLMAVYTNGTLYNYHFDGTGNTVALSDQSQTIVNRYAYGAYGKIKAAEETIQQPFQYVGQLGAFTESENFYYMKARYYDAELGRFIKQDPAGISGGLNLYAYVGGNPLVLVDPTGLSAQDFGFADVINFGIDAISVILIGADLILGGPTGEGIAPAIGLQGLKIGSKKAIKEGIYEFVDTSGKKYVGQSGNIAKRLQDHVRSGKLDPSQVKNVKVKEVLGGKTKREIAEQKRINEITNNVGAKSPKVSNQKNPIGPKRQHLLD
jgi:RHS repeat-associated protein